MTEPTTTELIIQHAKALTTDKIDNKYHHLVLLESLVKVALSVIRDNSLQIKHIKDE